MVYRMRRRTRRGEEEEEEEEEGLLTSNDECRSVGTGQSRAFLLESAQIRSHVAVLSTAQRAFRFITVHLKHCREATWG